MGNFDVTAPADSDFISLGDDQLRNDKAAIQEALRGGTTEGLEAIFPGSAPTTAPVFRYRGLKGTTGARPAFGQYGLYINTTLNTLQRDSGSAWEDVATLIPSGTKMPFYQASPPTGWTAVAVNDKFMRVVTSAGTGGTSGGTGLVPTSSISLAHSHTVASHTHSTPNHEHNLASSAGSAGSGDSLKIFTDAAGNPMYSGFVGGSFFIQQNLLLDSKTENSGAGTSGAATPGMDSQLSNISFQYADFCVGSKD